MMQQFPKSMLPPIQILTPTRNRMGGLAGGLTGMGVGALIQGGTTLDPNTGEPLPKVYPPFLPLLPYADKKFTLVLDLDETLVHYVESEREGHVLVRPGTQTFLKEMSQYYEISIFTAALQDVLLLYIYIYIYII